MNSINFVINDLINSVSFSKDFDMNLSFWKILIIFSIFIYGYLANSTFRYRTQNNRYINKIILLSFSIKPQFSFFICLGGLGGDETQVDMGYDVDIEIPKDQRKFTERPTVVLIHGWTGVWNINQIILTGPGFDIIRDVFYKHHNVNVVKVKWSGGGGNLYPFAAAAVPNIAKKVAAFLDVKLGKNPHLWRTLLVAGHSLGAHIAGEKSFKLKRH